MKFPKSAEIKSPIIPRRATRRIGHFSAAGPESWRWSEGWRRYQSLRSDMFRHQLSMIKNQDQCTFLVSSIDELEEQIAASSDNGEIADRRSAVLVGKQSGYAPTVAPYAGSG
jgi:hypothetical protein